MPNDDPPKAVTASVKLYGRLLAFYPAKFRREFGPAMRQVFRDQCRDAWSASQGSGLASLWLRLLPDLAKTSVTEHLLNLRQRESLLMKMTRAFRADPRVRRSFARMFVAVFAVALLFSALMSAWSPPLYSSKAIIEAHNDPSGGSPSQGQATNQLGNSDPYWVPTQLKIIQSYSVLTNVIVELNLEQKLPEQLGKSRWTLEETYLYLTQMIHVENTHMTSLIEITVRNRDPKMAAAIADKIVSSYRDVRWNQWRQVHLQQLDAYMTNLASNTDLLGKKQIELDKLRQKLGVPELDAPNAVAVETRTLEIWAEREALEKADYLEYSNTLFKLEQNPPVAGELPMALRKLNESELADKSARLKTARNDFTVVQAEYGVDHPKYKTTLDAFEQAQKDYDRKVEGIVAGVRERLDEDQSILQIIEQNKVQIKASMEDRLAALHPYYRLKDEVEGLRYNNRESQRFVNQEIAEARHADSRLVMVLDPARLPTRPVTNYRTFMIWALGGTLLALVAGAASAWIAVKISGLSKGQSAS